VLTVGGEVDDIQVQRRCVVGKFDEFSAASERCGRVEQVDERHRRDHSRRAARARRHGRGLEPAGDGEQAGGFPSVELDRVAVVIHDGEPRGHAPTVPGRGNRVRQVRAVVIADGALTVEERPPPDPGPGHVLVRVAGAGLNRADLAQRAGHYPAPPGAPADIPGVEFAGRVEAVGPDQGPGAPTVGDAVCGIVGGGAQAEYVVVHGSHCAPVPDGLDLVTMGGVPEVFITAHDAMVTQARAGAGEWVLVHAVGSGVGTAALQLAKAIGARVIGTARTASKLDRCRALGLDVGIEPPTNADGRLDTDALAWSIVEATDGGVNVVLDLVGGDYLAADVNAAMPRGRIVLISTMAGATATLPLGAILGKRLHVMGTVLRGRSVAEKAEATAAFVAQVVPLLADKTIAPVVDATLPLADASRAYDLLASDATFGKVILDCR